MRRGMLARMVIVSGHRGPGALKRRCPPRDATTAAAAVFVQLALRWRRNSVAFAVLGAQLGSLAAFGSGCEQALPGLPRKAPLN